MNLQLADSRCRYPGCVACCPMGCRRALGRVFEWWNMIGAAGNIERFRAEIETEMAAKSLPPAEAGGLAA